MRSRPRLLALGVALVAVVAVGVVPTGSASGAPGGDRKQELQTQIGEASAQEAAALANLQDIRNAKSAIDAKVADLDAQVNAAQAKLAPLEAEAIRLNTVFTALQAEVTKTQAKLDAAKLEFQKSAASLYRSARRGETFDLVLASRPDTMVKQNKYLDQVSAKRQKVVDRVAELRRAARGPEAEARGREGQGGPGRRGRAGDPRPGRGAPHRDRAGTCAGRAARSRRAGRDRRHPGAEGRLRGGARLTPGGVGQHLAAPPAHRCHPGESGCVPGATGARRDREPVRSALPPDPPLHARCTPVPTCQRAPAHRSTHAAPAPS